MAEHRLHPSVKEIIGLFKSKNYSPLTIQEIAKELNQSVNSINQSISRDNFRCFETIGKTPQKLRLKPGVDAIVFHLHNNQCYKCANFFAPDKLKVHVLDPNAMDPPAWTNLVPLCLDCALKPALVRKKQRKM